MMKLKMSHTEKFSDNIICLILKEEEEEVSSINAKLLLINQSILTNTR